MSEKFPTINNTSQGYSIETDDKKSVEKEYIEEIGKKHDILKILSVKLSEILV
jgi:hypothetical protein